MHREAVDAFCSGRATPEQEAELALQVARIHTCAPALPNHTVGLLGRLTRHLGGPEKVLDWLSGFPGEPALVAAVLKLGDLLGALSGSPPVIRAVAALRADRRYRDPFPDYWAPTTDSVTLSDLAETLVHLLRRDGGRRAVEASAHALDLVDDALRLVEAKGPDVRTARRYADDVREALQRAVRSPVPVGAG
jgi:hypothetical protein